MQKTIKFLMIFFGFSVLSCVGVQSPNQEGKPSVYRCFQDQKIALPMYAMASIFTTYLIMESPAVIPMTLRVAPLMMAPFFLLGCYIDKKRATIQNLLEKAHEKESK